MPYKPLKYNKDIGSSKGKSNEQLIRERTPIHSKTPNKNFYNNYDKIKWSVGRINEKDELD
jgi:hypothetical protein